VNTPKRPPVSVDQEAAHNDGVALDPVALGDSALQSMTLESVSCAVQYHDWLISLAQPYLGENPIELGSGLGDYAQTWLDRGAPRFTLTEVDPLRLACLRSRFSGDPRVSVKSIDFRSPQHGAHSAYLAFNVLEHIPDHVGALRAAHALVSPGGAVVMFVPAFEFAMSRFDRAVGHVRRYTVNGMTHVMAQAGLEVEQARYVNMPGLAAWFIGMRVLRMTPGQGRLLTAWDQHVVPRARRWEGRHHAPFGQSVFAIARVPRSAGP
jgi:hypothetical protein